MMLKHVSTGENVKIRLTERDNYDSSVWRNPYSIALDTIADTICPHCKKASKSYPSMKRWHFDNCKLKGII